MVLIMTLIQFDSAHLGMEADGTSLEQLFRLFTDVMLLWFLPFFLCVFENKIIAIEEAEKKERERERERFIPGEEVATVATVASHVYPFINFLCCPKLPLDHWRLSKY